MARFTGLDYQAGFLNPQPLIYVPEAQISGLSIYQATLPVGSIHAGTFTASASGGADVGPFQSRVNIGSEIQLTTSLEGVGFPCDKPVTINWTGGEPTAWITVSLMPKLEFPNAYGLTAYQGRVSDGAISIGPLRLGSACTSPPNVPLTLVIEVTPDPSQVTTITAPGLSLGGQHFWKYVYIFDALINYGT